MVESLLKSIDFSQVQKYAAYVDISLIAYLYPKESRYAHNATLNLLKEGLKTVGLERPDLMPVEVALASAYLNDIHSHLPMKQEAPAFRRG